MIKQVLLVLGILVASPLAHAVPEQPAPFEENSRALQLARRVATMENYKDLPSRAVWLGKKAAKSTRLAFKAKATKSKKKLAPANNINN